MTTDPITVDVPAGRFPARGYLRDDEARVLALWKIAFGKELALDIWRWKYADNPFGNRILLTLDPDNEIAVVMYSGVPYRTNWNGRTVEMVQLMDIMSHPDYRKTGLFVKSAESYFDLFAGGDSVLYYGIPGQYHYDIGAKYLAYSGLESGVAYFEGEPRALARPAGMFSGRLEASDEVDSGLDQLWSDLEGHYPLSVIRDAAFLRWRFGSHPTRRYTIYTFRSSLARKLRACAVVAFDNETATIVDLVLPPEQKTGVDFLAQVAAACAARGAEKVAVWVPGSHFSAVVLGAAGFVSKPEPLGIVPTARSFDPDLEIPWVSDNLYYTMADSDLR